MKMKKIVENGYGKSLKSRYGQNCVSDLQNKPAVKWRSTELRSNVCNAPIMGSPARNSLRERRGRAKPSSEPEMAKRGGVRSCHIVDVSSSFRLPVGPVEIGN